MDSGLTELSRRVGHLDVSVGDPARPYDLISDVERFVITMADVTAPGVADATSADEADWVVARCALLARLEEVVPNIVVGPVDPTAQYWIGTGKPTTVPAFDRRLQRRLFVDIPTAAAIPASTKPFSVGLFTSTAVAGTYGMWHTYLETSRSSLFPQPWFAWAVRPKPSARVFEVTTAAQWVQFVSRHAVSYDGLIYPDWSSAARDYDAVHVTMRAVVAIQGIPLWSIEGITAPAYWDVESTLWMRWCFQSVRLVSVEE